MTYIATVGDLHLYNRNLRSTLKMTEQSSQLLDEIRKAIEETDEIQILNFLGDIQHHVPSGKSSLKQITQWESQFMYIGEIMKQRFANVDVQVFGRDGQDMTDIFKNGVAYPLFVTKGNHDIDNETDFTFYDYLITKNILFEPLYLIVNGDIQINFYHYGEADKVIPKQDGIKKVIGLYHDSIDYPDMPFWMGDGAFKAVDILNDIDIALVGHIHKGYDPTHITTSNGTESVIWVQGSLGRTAFDEGQVRDSGIISILDINDLTQFGRLEIPLIPKEEYFNYRQAVMEQSNRRDLRNFSLNVTGIETTITDVRDEIRQHPEIEEDVKALAIKYLTEVIEG